MQYNSHANNLDCVSEVLKISGATTNVYPLNDITRRFNAGLDRYFQIAFESDSEWPFDDQNQTVAPILTQNIVSGTNSYRFTSFTASVNLLKLGVLDSNDNPIVLTPEKFSDIDLDKDYATSVTGTPTHYTKLGDFIYLRPTPNYSKNNALRAFIERSASYMAASDTTKVPGVPTAHQMYLCRYAALPYLIENNLPQTTAIASQIQLDEMQIKRDLTHRGKDIRPRLVVNRENNR